MRTSDSDCPLGWSVNVVDVPAGGLAWRHEATADECVAVQEALGIRAISALTARGRVDAQAGGRYRFTGEIAASLIQACVVSLEDVPEQVVEPFVVEFRPAEEAMLAETEVDFEAEADIEPIERGRMAVGRVIYETLAAGLDPYPRAAGSSLEVASAAPLGSELNPFAVLKSLGTPKKS
jgi:hypothetical protein